MSLTEDLARSIHQAGAALTQRRAGGRRRARTSDIFRELERCQISDLPYPWCACWACRPDIPFGADEATDDNTEENL